METAVIQPTNLSETSGLQPGATLEASVATTAKPDRAGPGGDRDGSTAREPTPPSDGEDSETPPGRPAPTETLPAETAGWEVLRDDGDEADDIDPDGSGPQDPLTRLERRIERHRRRMSVAAGAAMEAYYQFGEVLIEAKSLCPHGQWGPFLERCGLKERTAQQAMRIAHNRESIERVADGRTFSTIDAVRRLLPSKPKAIARTRPESETTPDGTEEDDDGDPVARGGTAHRNDEMGESSGDEPTVAADSTESQPDGQVGGDVVDPAELIEIRNPHPERSEPGGDEIRLPTPGPDEPPDREWLESLPLRARLEDPAHFDRHALLWRRARPLLAALRGLIDPSVEEIGHSCSFRMARNLLRLRLLFGIGVRDPHDWRVCDQCRGKFTARPGGPMPCAGCEGGGYLLTHEGEPPREAEAE